MEKSLVLAFGGKTREKHMQKINSTGWAGQQGNGILFDGAAKEKTDSSRMGTVCLKSFRKVRGYLT